MIWQIVKKDVRLLWPLIAISATLQLLGGLIEPRFGDGNILIPGHIGLFVVQAVAMAFLIIEVVHQNPVISSRRDLSVNPNQGRDLLIAKLLFILITVHIPMVFKLLLYGTALWVPLSISSAISFSIHSFIIFSLPIAILAALTSRTWQACMAFLILMMICPSTLGGLGFSYDWLPRPSDSNWDSGNQQLVTAMQTVVALLAAITILPLLYFRFRWLICCGLVVVFLLGYWCIAYVPWTNIIWAGREFISESAAARLSIAYDSDIGKPHDLEAGDDGLYIPLRISGLAKDYLLKARKLVVTLTGANGEVLYSNDSDPIWGSEYLGPLDHVEWRPDGKGDFLTHESFVFPFPDEATYAKLKGRAVYVQLKYELVLLHKGPSGTIDLREGKRQGIAGLGSCINIRYSNEVRCLDVQADTHCKSYFVEDIVTHQRNPAEEWGDADMVPPILRWPREVLTDSIVYSSDLRRGNLQNDYPVSETQLDESRLVITTAEPVAFFTRTIKTPLLKLDDLRALMVVPKPKQ